MASAHRAILGRSTADMPTIAQLQKQLKNLEYELEDVHVSQRTYKQRVANIAREIEEKQKPKLYTPSPFKATVSEIADLAVRVEASTADLDSAMLTRIKKCLDRARHPNTLKAEVKAALTLVNRLMRQYDVSQVEVLAHETLDKPRFEKGRSTVTIHPREGNKSTQVHDFYWLSALSSVMNCLFNTKAITSTYESREAVENDFCGIAENTVAAALRLLSASEPHRQWIGHIYATGVVGNKCNSTTSHNLERSVQRAAMRLNAEKVIYSLGCCSCATLGSRTVLLSVSDK